VRRFLNDLRDLFNILLQLAIIGFLIWFALRILFPAVPTGPQYDCDDKTLAMYEHFQSLGFEVEPIAGNLELENETLLQSNHVWLFVKMGDYVQAYDWGLPQFDAQHYFGYPISYQDLIRAVKADID